MDGRILLDTNAVIGLFKKDIALRKLLAGSEEIYLPLVALGELYYGACRSSRAETNIARVSEFAAGRSVLTCDENTALRYGAIKAKLRGKGRPIPDNALWIAAIAMQHGLTLVSRDAHFLEIEGLFLRSASAADL